MRSRVLALALLLVGPGVASPPAEALAQDLSVEARRQLEMARADLAAGQLQRGLQSAQSALRLDPLLYEAMVVQALAHEQLGDEDRAKALLVAYLELTTGSPPHPDAVAALERM
jgi:Tfp pilus assembly protein PilF